MHRYSAPEEYFLEVVKVGDEPEFPQDEGTLNISHQDLEGGFIQYWAYPKKLSADSHQSSDSLKTDSEASLKTDDSFPPAELTAQENLTPDPVLLIDQINDDLLELIIAKSGHAWAKSSSSLANLEDNISSTLDFAKEKYNLEITHFLTTSKVSKDIEEKLDKLAEEDNLEEEPTIIGRENPAPTFPPIPPISHISLTSPTSSLQTPPKNSSFSKLAAILIPIIVLGSIAGGAFMFKGKILSKINPLTSSNSPTPPISPTSPISQITPTPTPISRENYQVRVLNGTKKTGAAKTLADTLKEKGWEILSIGNAKDQTLAQTTIKAKKDLDAVVSQIITDLGTDYEVTIGAILSSTDKTDIEISIGKK